MKNWIWDHDVLVFGVVLVLVLALVCVGAYYDEDAWTRYVVAHHCEVKGHSEPRNGLGVGSNGQSVVTYISGQTIYVCDGGEIILR